MRHRFLRATALLVVAVTSVAPAQQKKPRARDLGVPFDGTPGPLNAITDIAGIEVGQTTVVFGNGRLDRGKGPARTGVTAILPRGKTSWDPVFAAWFPLNGNGEMTGTPWVEESGFLEGPILITNTHSVGTVRDATIEWEIRHGRQFLFTYPLVAETWDGVLNDVNGFHVKPEHVWAALDGAQPGPVTEGAVGGGTGMVCNGWKGGNGTSSRRVTTPVGTYTVGVFVQCNYGGQRGLRIAGVPVGTELTEQGVCAETTEPPSQRFLKNVAVCGTRRSSAVDRPHAELGSIIIIVATDAPLLAHQLKRLVKRATLGLGREGSLASNFSGDLFLAFSTANAGAGADSGLRSLTMMPNEQLDPLFLATVQATEEAVTNALFAAETMTGADRIRANALPTNEVMALLRKYGRVK